MTAAEKIVRYLADARDTEVTLRRLCQTQVAASRERDYRDLLRRHQRGAQSRARRVERRLVEVADHRGAAHEASATPLGLLSRALGLSRGPIDLVCGGDRGEKLLRNAKFVLAAEAFGTVTYDALEAVCRDGEDWPSADLADELRSEQEKLAAELRRLIPTLVAAAGADRGRAGQTRQRVRLVEEAS